MSELSPYVIQRLRPQEREAVALPAMTPLSDAAAIREYWLVIRRHLSLIAAIVASGLLLAGVAVFVITPTYTATAVILIEPQPPQVLDIKQLSVEPPDAEAHDYYKTQYALLKGRGLAARVIHSLALQDNPAFNPHRVRQSLVVRLWSDVQSLGARKSASAEAQADDDTERFGLSSELIDDYLDHLKVEPQFGTRLVSISFSSPDPRLSARVANAHARAYVRQGLELRAQAGESAQRFLEAKLVELRERVEKSEAALNSYRHDKGIVDFSTKGNNRMLMGRLEYLDNAVVQAETRRIALEAQVDAVRRRDYSSLPQVVSSPMVQALQPQLASLEAQYASMSSRYTDAYAPLAALKAKLQDTRALLARTVNDIVDSVRLSYQTALSREEKLQEELNAEKARALALHDAALQDGILARDVDTNRQLYESVLKRMKEIGVTAEIQSSNVSMVDRAAPPLRPSSPRKLLTLMLAGILGLSGGIGVAFFLEYIDDTFKTPEDVERHLRLPSLALVPEVRHAGEKTFQFLAGSLRLSGSPERAALGIYYGNNGSGIGAFAAAVEAYRTLRGRILLSRADRPPRTVLITSAIPGEGKTVTAVNTAITFAQKGRRVLLIDADLRRPRCHNILGCESEPGLSELLTGQAEFGDVIAETEIAGLSFLGAGAEPPDPPELLGSEKMKSVLAHLTGEYDHVIIDSAPIMPVSDSIMLSGYADGVVLVVGPSTARHIVRRACERISGLSGNLLGAILNRVKVHPFDYGHYSGYNYSYHHPYRRNDSAANGNSKPKEQPALIFD